MEQQPDRKYCGDTGLTVAIQKNESQNEKEHKAIWAHEAKQDEKLDEHSRLIGNHETRLRIIEESE